MLGEMLIKTACEWLRLFDDGKQWADEHANHSTSYHAAAYGYLLLVLRIHNRTNTCSNSRPNSHANKERADRAASAIINYIPGPIQLGIYVLSQ